jgi:hypothetical protein
MYGWNERPSKASVKHLIGGDKPATVYSVGQYEVSVGADGEVTYKVPYHRPTDPRNVLPNMEIADGEIRIPVSDLVGAALARLDPVELAQSLWTNDEVRAVFIAELGRRWGDSFTDADRRKALFVIQEAVHSQAVDKLAGEMAEQERAAREAVHTQYRRREFRDWLRSVEETLQSYPEALEAARVRNGFGKVFLADEEESDFSIGGKHWNEARSFWRAEVLKQFPMPPEPVEATDSDALEF